MRLLPIDHPMVRGKSIGDLVMLAEQDRAYSYETAAIYRITWRRRDEYFLALEDHRLKMLPLPVLIASSKIAAARSCAYHDVDNNCYLRKEPCTQPACYREGKCEAMRSLADKI